MIINIPAIEAWWDATLIKIFRQIPYPNDVGRAEETVLVSEAEASASGVERGLRQRMRDRHGDGGEEGHEGAERRRPGWRLWEYIW